MYFSGVLRVCELGSRVLELRFWLPEVWRISDKDFFGAGFRVSWLGLIGDRV